MKYYQEKNKMGKVKEHFERLKEWEQEFVGQSYDPRKEAAKQVGGTHYVRHNIQPWDIIDEYGLDYYRGNAIKYILRNKMDVYEDIRKAIHYLEYWLEQAQIEDNRVEEYMRKLYFDETGEFASDEVILSWWKEDQ